MGRWPCLFQCNDLRLTTAAENNSTNGCLTVWLCRGAFTRESGVLAWHSNLPHRGPRVHVSAKSTYIVGRGGAETKCDWIGTPNSIHNRGPAEIGLLGYLKRSITLENLTDLRAFKVSKMKMMQGGAPVECRALAFLLVSSEVLGIRRF